MWGNIEEWVFSSVCEVFVLLAEGTSLDVSRDPLVHSRPPVRGGDLSGGFIPPWVSCNWSTMIVMEDAPFYLFIRGNNYLLLRSPQVGGGNGVSRGGVEEVFVFPFDHECSVSSLCQSDSAI